MRTHRPLTTLAMLLSLGLLGCHGGGAGGESTSGGEVDYSGPIASTDVAEGENQFEMYCSGCHPGGQGSRSGPEIAGKQLTPGAARQQIRQGGRHMPDFGVDEIGDSELEALLAFLVTLDVVQAPAPIGDTPVDAEPEAAQ